MKLVFSMIKAVFWLVVLGIAVVGTIDRLYWVNSNSEGLNGAMSSSLLEEKFGITLDEMCRHDKPQHVDFKVLPDKTLQLRCSWFEGGGLSLWPFYSTISVSKPEVVDAFSRLFTGPDLE
ncbi:hypothetical protein [Aeromonas caviae]|uniref:hypothetical protein n=1 Tax=Aeromonas caviae TaxID=648 RepID=UPI001CC3D15E|nr:hypothetical protein [Aeromonas caviae]GJA77585.1 hypothetical protein KAM354_28210 [Aeromonas caviae]HDT5889340.1 hypothetical protein [Aeromonas dhakensis]HEB4980345.1 hypothetical protein [Aeromonas dhakensis]